MPLTDDAHDSFVSPNNPSQGTLGTWSYGYLAPGDVYTLLPNLVTNAVQKLTNWQITAPNALPRITHNFGTADKTLANVRYPVDDFLVVKPAGTTPAAVRFTADVAGTYDLDVTFRSMRTKTGATATVSVEQNGAVVAGCTGPIDGLLTDVVGNELVCPITVTLDVGETLDFVVDSEGSSAAYDDVGLAVAVVLQDDTDGDGLSDGDEALLGTNPLLVDTDLDDLTDGDEVLVHLSNPLDTDSDDDTLLDGDEVGVYGTSPILADTDGGSVNDAAELANETDPVDVVDDVTDDDAEGAFLSPNNPSQGALGTWSYGYDLGGVFTLLPNLVTNAAQKLTNWQISGGGAVPRITDNFGTGDKTYASVKYPLNDFLVAKPKVGNDAVLRFTADADGSYRFDTTFRSARVTTAANTLVSVEQGGVVVDLCAGSVIGLVTDVGTNEVRCDALEVPMVAGETIDFVVDANGAGGQYDDVALRVRVYEID